MAETEAKESAPAKTDQNVNLGLGTLVIVALIVTMCSGKGEVKKIQKDTTELKKQLGVIDKKLDVLLQNGGAAASTNAEAPAAPADAGAAPTQNR